MSKSTIYDLASGERVVWAKESGAIMLKTREPFGDPVELGEEEALELGELLVRLAQER
ncbi:MAG: hypothetical protein JSR66_34095 [Proteobacteria bacterium]|nr:hypothetical protein [Pseudomonadota bacterium]